MVLALVVAMVFLSTPQFWAEEDGFVNNLIIPTDVEMAEPANEQEASPGQADSFQQELLTALSKPGNDDPTITADVGVMLKLNKTAPEIFRQFLAANPAWRVFKERGNVFATRRWMIGSNWQYNLHGYYTRSAIDAWAKTGVPNFQSRFTLGFSGKPWAGASTDSTQMDAGQTRSMILTNENQMYESHCIIKGEELFVEVFEQSEARERRLSKAALSHIEKELSSLGEAPTRESIRTALPSGSIRTGAPVLELSSSFQPGIYNSAIWVNPGEPGMLYLKAFEFTNGTPLSADRLKEMSNEWIGWSDDPKELFFSNTHFTIYEGDWGKPYAARFEIWFTPDSGAADRKLLEKVYKIEGWQR